MNLPVAGSSLTPPSCRASVGGEISTAVLGGSSVACSINLVKLVNLGDASAACSSVVLGPPRRRTTKPRVRSPKM